MTSQAVTTAGEVRFLALHGRACYKRGGEDSIYIHGLFWIHAWNGIPATPRR